MSLRGIAATAAAVIVAGVLAAIPGPPQLTASWTGWLNGGLEAYADTASQGNGGGHWNSGGSPVTVALPGGRVLWLVPDSYTGPVDADGTVSPARTRYTPNALLVTQGSGASFRVLAAVSRGLPVAGAPAGGVVSGNVVLAVYDVVTSSGAPSGTEIVRMPLSSLTRPATYTVTSVPSRVQWMSLLSSSACPPATRLSRCVYLYGARSGRLAEAVAPPSLAGRWRYRAVAGIPVGSGLSAYQVSDGSYVALTGSGAGVTAYYASSPTLADAARATLFAAPAVPGVPGSLAYQFRIEPAYSHGPDVVMGFSVNSADHDRACLNYAPFYDVAAYQPEFYSFTLPSSSGTAVAGTLPPPRFRAFGRSPVPGERWSAASCSGFSTVPAPSGFQARYGGTGRVDLTWSDPGGLYSYDIRFADAGNPGGGWRELRYPVWDGRCPGRAGNCVSDTADASFLAPGHTYRYQISAWNWAGGRDGGFARSERASVTLPAKITAVRSGLCVTGAALGSCSGRPGWRYIPVGKGAYALSPLGRGRCLVPSGRSVALGSCSAAARAWEFRITDGAYDFNLRNQATGRCLAVSGGARLVQSRCVPSPAAIWHSSFS